MVPAGMECFHRFITFVAVIGYILEIIIRPVKYIVNQRRRL